jgi:hypothetical protein
MFKTHTFFTLPSWLRLLMVTPVCVLLWLGVLWALGSAQ